MMWPTLEPSLRDDSTNMVIRYVTMQKDTQIIPK